MRWFQFEFWSHSWFCFHNLLCIFFWFQGFRRLMLLRRCHPLLDFRFLLCGIALNLKAYLNFWCLVILDSHLAIIFIIITVFKKSDPLIIGIQTTILDYVLWNTDRAYTELISNSFSDNHYFVWWYCTAQRNLHGVWMTTRD